jgi:type II secretory pathway pseudopilin PulG
MPSTLRFDRRPERAGNRGVVLLALLLALTLGGIAMMAAVDVWAVTRQQAREQELLFVGEQYRSAVRRYYFGGPQGAPRTLPGKLEDLLEDDRYPLPVRHLRRLYPDPITGSAEWGVLRIGTRVAGVYSLSDKQPLKQAEFPPAYQHLAGKSTYRDWVFAIGSSGQPVVGHPAAASAAAGATSPNNNLSPVRRSPS